MKFVRTQIVFTVYIWKIILACEKKLLEVIENQKQKFLDEQ